MSTQHQVGNANVGPVVATSTTGAAAHQTVATSSTLTQQAVSTAAALAVAASTTLAPPLHFPSNAPPFFQNTQLRRGKWTTEEEQYAEFLIRKFEQGVLGDECENGCTLRVFLSRKLHCAPMRISKKYAGKSIGKLIYLAKDVKQPGVATKLRELEVKFYKSLCDELSPGAPTFATRYLPLPPLAGSAYPPPSAAEQTKQLHQTYLNALHQTMHHPTATPHHHAMPAAAPTAHPQVPLGHGVHQQPATNHQGVAVKQPAAPSNQVALAAAASSSAQHHPVVPAAAPMAQLPLGHGVNQQPATNHQGVAVNQPVVAAPSNQVALAAAASSSAQHHPVVPSQGPPVVTHPTTVAAGALAVTAAPSSSGLQQAPPIHHTSAVTVPPIAQRQGAAPSSAFPHSALPSHGVHLPASDKEVRRPPVVTNSVAHHPIAPVAQPHSNPVVHGTVAPHDTIAPIGGTSQLQSNPLQPRAAPSTSETEGVVVEHAKAPEVPDFLSGFEKVEDSSWAAPNVSLLGSLDSSSVPLQCSPPLTSKSFDELHRLLGSDLSPKPFDLNNNDASHDDESNRHQAAPPSGVNPVVMHPVSPSRIRSEPTLRHTNGSLQQQVCSADIYATFAQQSAVAVSQHSAYCRQSEGTHNAAPPPTVPVGLATMIQGGNTNVQIPVSHANLRAHTQRLVPLRPKPPAMTAASSTHIVSGSERSSEMGTEDGSALGSSGADSDSEGAPPRKKAKHEVDCTKQ